MRGSHIGTRLSAHSTALGSVPFQTLFPSASSAAATFSTFAAGGGGRGRGRGAGGIGSFVPGAAAVKPESDASQPESNEPPFPSGLGHGRGKPIPTQPTPPILPSFSSWTTSQTPPPYAAAGRGRFPQPAESGSQSIQPPGPTKPIASFREEGSEMGQQTRPRVWGRGTKEPVGEPPVGDQQANDASAAQPQKGSEMVQQTRPRVWGSGRGAGERFGKPVNNFQENGLVPSIDSSAGRGKPAQPWGQQRENIEEVNRHLRAAPARGRGGGTGSGLGGHFQAVQEERPRPASPKLNREEAVKAAMGILSRGEAPGRGGGGGRGRGNSGDGRGEGRRRRGGRGRSREDDDDGSAFKLSLGNNADGERLAKTLGVEKMNKLHEVFDEAANRAMPSAMEHAYIDALYTNYSIECEPEWLMEEFGTNPDIDETPPISLQDGLEKVKPFICAYENIRTEEEWQEAVKEVMSNLPHMKAIVDHFSGPDRITAKTQKKELERVASTLPESAPASVKRFADHAVQCLQNNPGWNFLQKHQFMDMLVEEVSENYK